MGLFFSLRHPRATSRGSRTHSAGWMLGTGPSMTPRGGKVAIKTNLSSVIPAKRSSEPGPVSRDVYVFIQRLRRTDPGSASGMTMERLVGKATEGLSGMKRSNNLTLKTTSPLRHPRVTSRGSRNATPNWMPGTSPSMTSCEDKDPSTTTRLSSVIPAKQSAEPEPGSRDVCVVIQRPRPADPGSASGMTMERLAMITERRMRMTMERLSGMKRSDGLTPKASPPLRHPRATSRGSRNATPSWMPGTSPSMTSCEDKVPSTTTRLSSLIPAKRSAEPGPVIRKRSVFIRRLWRTDPGSASGMTKESVSEKGAAL